MFSEGSKRPNVTEVMLLLMRLSEKLNFCKNFDGVRENN